MKTLFPAPNGLRALIHQEEKAQRGRLVAASLCAMVVSAAAVILLGLSAWFLTASAIAGLAGPMVAKAFNFMIPSAMIRLLAILRTAGRYGERVLGHDAALNALAHLRPRLFSQITRSGATNALSLTSGETSARLMQDVEAIQNRFVRLSAPWGAMTALAAGIIVCSLAGWVTAAVVAAVSGVYILGARILAHRLTRRAGQDVRAAAGEFKQSLSSFLAAAPELRAYGMTATAMDRVAAKALVYDKAQYRLSAGTGWIGLWQSLCMALSVIAVVLCGTNSGAPLLALALLGSIAVIDAAATLVGSMAQHGSVEAAIARLEPLTQHCTGTSDKPLKPRIEIQGLFTLRTRGRLGIRGHSGSGKTTLVEQLMLLRDAPFGVASLDGCDITELHPEQARSLFAYAPQQTQFLNGTVAENLKLAAPSATQADMWAALKDACLDERIINDPLGLDMPVGENGLNLSGGERRRLGLARAYLRSAPFLVLDEPTEGLDEATEVRIIERLDTRLKLSGQGLILISHRPAPLGLCQDLAEVTGRGRDNGVHIRVAERSIEPHQNPVV